MRWSVIYVIFLSFVGLVCCQRSLGTVRRTEFSGTCALNGGGFSTFKTGIPGGPALRILYLNVEGLSAAKRSIVRDIAH